LKKFQLAKRCMALAERWRALREGQRRRWEKDGNIASPLANASDERRNSGTSHVFADEMRSMTMGGTSMEARRSELASTRKAVEESTVRDEELARIEKSIGDLVALFADMRDLIEAQDNTIVTIETTLEDADVELEKGVGEMDKAIIIRKRTRRRCMWAAAVLVLAAVLTATMVVLYFELWAPKSN
ncbi:hypothetical protein HK101_005157, partial [Irineochytrium annulatum]